MYAWIHVMDIETERVMLCSCSSSIPPPPPPPPPPTYHGNNHHSDPEQQKVAEVAQQSLTDFVQTLVGGCLQTMLQRLKKEVTFRGKKLIAISRLYSLFFFKLPSLPFTFLPFFLSSPHPLHSSSLLLPSYFPCHLPPPSSSITPLPQFPSLFL